MPTPFAAMQDRINTVCRAKLANATAVFAGLAAPVDGLFENGFSAELGMVGAEPRFGCPEAEAPGVAQGHELTIGAVDYVVKGVEPDGTGWVRFILEVV